MYWYLVFLLHVVHAACRVSGFMFLMTRCCHQFTKRMIAFSHSCPTYMTSLSHKFLVSLRFFSIAYYVDDYW